VPGAVMCPRLLVVGADLEKPGLELLALADDDGVGPVRQAALLQHDMHLVAVRGRPGVEIDHRLRRPDWSGGKANTATRAGATRDGHATDAQAAASCPS